MRQEFQREKVALTVKEDKAEYIKECYTYFGWELIEEEADRNFFDIRHLAFSRPYDIPNKDMLQYLQVRMEMRFNQIQTLQRKRFALSSSFALGSVIVGILLLLLGLYFLIPYTHPIIGTALCVLSAILFIDVVVFGRSLVVRENKRFLSRVSQMEKEIIEFCREGERLLGGENGSKEI